jgi:N-acetylglucosaminyldiphosphoundecaprenol N-acetyl-beta-D-mannosaminyltransferase
MSEVPTIRLLGYNIFSGRKEFFSGSFGGVVNTLSPHSWVTAREDELFHDSLMNSNFLLPDGVGIVMAARILKGEKIRKIAGSDLHIEVLKSLNERNSSCFYLGSSEQTLEKIRAKVENEYPSIKTGIFSPPFKNVFSDEDNSAMLKAVNDFNPEVLFVGMTAPKQEKWVHEHRNKINAPVICSIGAVFDFYTGNVKRPGEFWISIGLEWLPRLLREPRRLWRRTVVSTPVFMWCVLKEKMRKG